MRVGSNPNPFDPVDPLSPCATGDRRMIDTPRRRN